MKGIRKIVSESFEIPSEAMGSVTVFTAVGREKIIIENPKGIAKYETDVLRINTSEGIAEIEGENMEIKELAEGCVVAEGKITSIKFI